MKKEKLRLKERRETFVGVDTPLRRKWQTNALMSRVFGRRGMAGRKRAEEQPRIRDGFRIGEAGKRSKT